MRLRFNRMERLAGAFILLAVAGTAISAGVILLRKGFFDKKIAFRTVIPSSDSIYSGMPVLMSGVRIGKVEEIELDPSGEAEVTFSIRDKYAARIRKDSHVSISRQSLIGEKIFDVSTGTKDAGPAKPGQVIDLRAAGDVMGALTGARIGQILDNVDRLLVEYTEVAQQLTRKRATETLVANLKEMSSGFPQISRDLATLTEQIARMDTHGDTRIAQILADTSVLIRALQKNFLVRGSVAEVKKEEQAALKSAEDRKPAGSPPQN